MCQLQVDLPLRREDILSADQAVEAVATLLHHLVPAGDMDAAATALHQVCSSYLCVVHRFVCSSCAASHSQAAEQVLQWSMPIHVIVACQLHILSTSMLMPSPQSRG